MQPRFIGEPLAINELAEGITEHCLHPRSGGRRGGAVFAIAVLRAEPGC